MPVSPQDYALWAEATGNKYPSTPQEKARLAPEVYDFTRGFGKFQGFNSFEGFQGDIVYDQPQAIRHYGDNTLLQSPITPDNNIPKVAGQLNNTLTGRHYTQNYADDASETGFGGTEQPTSLLQKAALGALGVGAVAAGAYGLQKATGRDLGVGKVGGMVRNLGQRAESGLKSALGLADEAAGPQFVTRQAVDETLATAQQGISAIDDVAPGIVREQNVIPVGVRAQQQMKSRIPDPWSESALGQAGQTMSAPAMQSVIATQTTAAGVDPNIQSRIGQFKAKHASLFGVPNVPYSYEGAPYNQRTFYGPTSVTPVRGQADEAYANLVRSAGPPRKTVLSGIDPQTNRPYSTTVLRSELIGSGQPLVTVPGKVGTVSASSPVPERPSVIGSYPGPEGSSAQGVQFTALQGMTEGRPYRYTVLPTEAPSTGESVAEFLQRIDTPEGLGGLLAPQRPLPPGSLSGTQRTLATDSRIATAQKQAEAIFQATGDPSVLRGAYGESVSLPTRVVLPSGESVPTGSLYEAFAQIVNTKTGIPVVQSRAESLQAALNMQGAMKARALEQLGLPSTYQPSQAQLQQLDPRTKRLLGQTAGASEAARNRLQQAEASQLRYKLKPEITEGIREVPIISEATGEVVGSRVVPEAQGIPTSKYYQMRATGGAGRQETGGIGRRREVIEGMEGRTFGLGTGSLEDVTPVLYKGVDDATGQAAIFRPEDVSPMQIATGAVTPVRGTAVEPQRIMGREGRTFKGVAANVIDPASFDPGLLSEIAKAAPERIDPTTGLAYSQQAMGGEKAAQRRRQIETMRQSGQRVRGRRGTELPASIVRGGAISESGVDPALGTQFSRRGPIPEGSARAQQVELMRQRDELVRKALRGEL